MDFTIHVDRWLGQDIVAGLVIVAFLYFSCKVAISLIKDGGM